MRRNLFLLLLFGIVLSCNPLGPIGPNKIKITISGGAQPVISWKGGPVHNISVSLHDSLITIVSPNGFTDQRNPIVWGYQTFDSSGKKVSNIISPVRFGSIIAHATDISDSAYRTDSMIPGVTYQIRLATEGPSSTGYTIYTPRRFQGMGIHFYRLFANQRCDAAHQQTNDDVWRHFNTQWNST